MTPYAQLWLLQNAPTVLVIALWLTAAATSHTRARWAWLGAGLIGSAPVALEFGAVLSGGLPGAWLRLVPHIGWIGLSAAIVLADRRRVPAYYWSFALAVAAAAVHAWLLALVLVVGGHAERSRALRVGVGSLVAANLAGDHLAPRAFAALGRLGLSLDATGVAMAWGHGLALVVGWSIVAVTLDRMGRHETPPRPAPPSPP